jgi:organic radical activating enzyme
MFTPDQTTYDYMSLVLTHECNKKCPFCVDAYRGSGEVISLENVRNALRFAGENEIKDILIIGGEPTLHPAVEIIAGMVKDAGFRSILTTNYTKPATVKALDGLVDCFNISYYNQPELPKQADFKSDLTLHALIHGKQLATRESLDQFIDTHQEQGHLKFSTLVPCNEWAAKNQAVHYLDALECEWMVLFNELLGQKYRGAIIKRYDRIINRHAHQSYKAHVDGSISQSWERPLIPANAQDDSHGSRLGNHMETPFDHMETDWKLDSNRWFPAHRAG